MINNSSSSPRYTEEQREMVIKYYPTCKTRQEKLELCKKVGIRDIRRLYNLACQLGLTRTNEDLSNAEFFRYMAGEKSVLQMKRRFQQNDEKEILLRRESPKDIAWSKEDDKFLQAHFGAMGISQIALQRGHSETAIMYYARHITRRLRDADGKLMPAQPLRKPAYGFALDKVCAWLGLDEDELRALQATADVQIKPLPTVRNGTQTYLVVAESLQPFLKKFGKKLQKEKGADEFFILEILETADLLKKGETTQEGCLYLDNGHKCQNAWAGPCYGRFCDGYDGKCHVRNMPLTDLRGAPQA